MKNTLLIHMTSLFAVLAAPHLAAAAETGLAAPAESRFVLTGYGYASYLDPDGADGSFDMAFAPIFLYRVSDKLLFEAELEFGLDENVVETELEYAQIDWLVSDNLTVVAGKFLTPFGSFIEKLHPAWVNKLPTAPLPYQHSSSLVPFGQTGVQLRGGIPLAGGYGRVSYSLFLSNGLGVSTHGHEEPAADEHAEDEPEHPEEEPESLGDDPEHLEGEPEPGHDEDAELIYLTGSSSNSNGDLGFGGRVAIVPALGFEFGVSYLTGNYDELGVLDATMTGAEFTYHHDLFDIRAEWLESVTERGVAEDGDLLADQEIESWYFQPSLRLSVLPAYAFNRMELVARLANLDWGAGDEDQTSIGLNYYLTTSSALRVAWERLEGTDRETENAVNVMLALGF